MRVLLGLGILTAMGGAAWLVTTATAQPPGGPPPGRGRDRGRPAEIAAAVERMMTFDANHDGELSKEEITDTRLLALFESADQNHDAKVTTEELTSQLTKDAESLGPGGPPVGPAGGEPDWGGPERRGGERREFGRRDADGRGPGRRGPEGPPGLSEPPGLRRPGGPFPPGLGGPPPVGQVLPEPLQDMLKLSAVQRNRIEALQKHVDRRMGEILTEDQLEQLEGFRHRGPMGPSGMMGPGGPRGRRGPPDREVPPGRRENRDEFNPPPRRPTPDGESESGPPPGDRGRPRRPPVDEADPE